MTIKNVTRVNKFTFFSQNHTAVRPKSNQINNFVHKVIFDKSKHKANIELIIKSENNYPDSI